MSLEMNMMCKEVRPQPGSKKRRFEGDPFKNIHSSNFAPEERYIGSQQPPTQPPRSGGALYWLNNIKNFFSQL